MSFLKIKLLLRRNFFQPNYFFYFLFPFSIYRKQTFLALKKILPNLKGKILDIGCGSKPYENLCIKSSEYIGIDLKHSGHDHKNSKVDIFFDGVHLPFKDISFDNIIALEVLEHVEELDDLMFEINRALKKDGFFVASIPFGWPEHEKPFDFRRFTTFGIEKLLIKNKFEIVLISKSGTLISSLLQIIIYYIDDIFSKTGKLRYFLWPIYSIPINSLSLILDFLLPKNKDFYSNLIVVAKKV